MLNPKSVSLSFISTATEDSENSITESYQIRIIFMIEAYTNYGCSVKLSGNTTELGFWDPLNSISLFTTAEAYPI